MNQFGGRERTNGTVSLPKWNGIAQNRKSNLNRNPYTILTPPRLRQSALTKVWSLSFHFFPCGSARLASEKGHWQRGLFVVGRWIILLAR